MLKENIDIYSMVSYKGRLYFIYNMQNYDEEFLYGAGLGKSDGTVAGTVRIKELLNRGELYTRGVTGVHSLNLLNDTLFTVVAGPLEYGNTYVLWKSDGTVE